MPVPPEVLEQVRTALSDTPSVADARIDVRAEDDAVVLAGAVSSPEQADTAALVASRHVDAIDNRLHVDPHLREDASAPDAGGGAAPNPRRPPRSEQLTVQSSSGEPEAVGMDLQQDADRALAENTPLDPPEVPQTARTAREQRGEQERESAEERIAEPGHSPEDGDTSLPDLSRQELEQRARPKRDDAG